MSRRDKRPYEERAAEFLEPGEKLEKILTGRLATSANVFYPFGKVNRQVVLTDRNLYVFELEGKERWLGGTPSRMLAKHQRGNGPARYRVFPPTMIVGPEEVRPAGRGMVANGKPIVKAAASPTA